MASARSNRPRCGGEMDMMGSSNHCHRTRVVGSRIRWRRAMCPGSAYRSLSPDLASSSEATGPLPPAPFPKDTTSSQATGGVWENNWGPQSAVAIPSADSDCPHRASSSHTATSRIRQTDVSIVTRLAFSAWISWVVISGVISPLIWVISIVTLLITRQSLLMLPAGPQPCVTGGKTSRMPPDFCDSHVGGCQN